MFKLIVFVALLALAAAAPGLLSGPVIGSPLAYSAVPAPYAYVTGHRITYTVEPVEQHGYRIAF